MSTHLTLHMCNVGDIHHRHSLAVSHRQYELVERRDGEKSNCEGLYKVIVSQVESQLTKESCSDRAEEHTLVFSCSK